MENEVTKTLFKDERTVNQYSNLRESMDDLAEIIKRAGGVCKNRKVLIEELLNGATSQQIYVPNHKYCSDCESEKVTEKRICRCMYYYLKKPELCQKCNLEKKWHNVGKIEILDYERPTTFVLKNVGGMDLIVKDGEQKYAVEEKNIKPAICFFEDSEQMQQYMELKNEKNEALAYIMKFVKVFYFKTKKNPVNADVIDFEICEIEKYENIENNCLIKERNIMGKYNSSIHRVRPLVECIKNDFCLFEKVLKLVGIEGVGTPQCFGYDGIDCQEKQLKPSKDHLIKLIKYISEKDFGDAVIENAKRKQLCISDGKNMNCRSEACDEAITELNKAYDSMDASCKAWYVFEGFSNPDIFIEGEDYVIVCEGKWTESHITVQTTNLTSKEGEYRNQMTRHIQGALNYTNKKVYAFYIVDKECGYLADLTREAFKEQLSKETIDIDDFEKEKIMDAFRGYTTWQDIEAVIPGIHFKTKEEILLDSGCCCRSKGI